MRARGFTPWGSRAGPHSGPIPLTRSRVLGAAPQARPKWEAHLQDWTRGSKAMQAQHLGAVLLPAALESSAIVGMV